MKRRIGMTVAAVLLLVQVAPSQSSVVRWWALDGGFSSSLAANSRLLSAVGQTFVGSARAGSSTVVNGFLADTLLRAGPVSGIEHAGEVPLSYELGQNYPNPFNPATTISFALPREGHVRLALYDLLGRLVEELIDGEYRAGLYRVQWDARAYSSGVYVYRIEAGDFVATRKLVVLK